MTFSLDNYIHTHAHTHMLVHTYVHIFRLLTLIATGTRSELSLANEPIQNTPHQISRSLGTCLSELIPAGNSSFTSKRYLREKTTTTTNELLTILLVSLAMVYGLFSCALLG